MATGAGEYRFDPQGSFGPLFEAIGLEGARCYLEFGVAEARTRWALGLQDELRQTRWLSRFGDGRRS